MAELLQLPTPSLTIERTNKNQMKFSETYCVASFYQINLKSRTNYESDTADTSDLTSILTNTEKKAECAV